MPDCTVHEKALDLKKSTQNADADALPKQTLQCNFFFSCLSKY